MSYISKLLSRALNRERTRQPQTESCIVSNPEHESRRQRRRDAAVRPSARLKGKKRGHLAAIRPEEPGAAQDPV